MNLTEEDVVAIVERRIQDEPGYFPGCDVRATYWRLYDRAVRLLPLWRKWGLQELQADGYEAGHHDGRKVGYDEGDDQGYLDGYLAGREGGSETRCI